MGNTAIERVRGQRTLQMLTAGAYNILRSFVISYFITFYYVEKLQFPKCENCQEETF